jgi:hypothetical protein
VKDLNLARVARTGAGAANREEERLRNGWLAESPTIAESTHGNAWMREVLRADATTKPTQNPVITKTGLNILRYI